MRICVIYKYNPADILKIHPSTPSRGHSEMRSWLLAFLCLSRTSTKTGPEIREYLSLPHDVGATRTPTSGPRADVACASACSHSAECVGFVWDDEKVRERLPTGPTLVLLLDSEAVGAGCLNSHGFLRRDVYMFDLLSSSKVVGICYIIHHRFLKL